MANFDMDDEKLASIPDGERLEAVGLWVLAASWAWEQRNGGYVPASMLHVWEASESLAQTLINARLWAPISGDEDGYIFIGTWVRG